MKYNNTVTNVAPLTNERYAFANITVHFLDVGQIVQSEARLKTSKFAFTHFLNFGKMF